MISKFAAAFAGIRKGLSHRAIVVQFILAALAAAVGFVLRLDSMEWCAVVICIAAVISAEMLNTCVEKLCDLYTDTYNETVRTIKDIAAGAVLCASLGALICALIILARRL